MRSAAAPRTVPTSRSILDNGRPGPLCSVMDRNGTTEPGAVVADERYVKAVRKALEASPISRRELARRVGVSHATLNRIASGETESTRKLHPIDVAEALDAISRECEEASAYIWAVKDAYGMRLEKGPDDPDVRAALEKLDRDLDHREA